MQRSLPILIGGIFPEFLIALLCSTAVCLPAANSSPFIIFSNLVMIAFFLYGLHYLLWRKTRFTYAATPGNYESIGQGFVAAFNDPMHYFFWISATTFARMNDWLIPGKTTSVVFATGALCGALTMYLLVAMLGERINLKKILSVTILSIKIHGLLVLAAVTPMIINLIRSLVN
ncbi:MAG: hypothetical protein V4543_02260 [Bacteroidota bacterium]